MKAKYLIRKKFSKKQDKLTAMPALLGDGRGTVNVPNRPNYVYARIPGFPVSQVYNNRVMAVPDLPVLIGKDPLQPSITQVLGVRSIPRYGEEGETIAPIQAHAATHRWLGDGPGGGSDVLWTELRQFLPWRLGPGGGLTVHVYRGLGYINGAWTQVAPATTTDLTSYVPTADGKAKYVLIAINTSGAVTVTAGSEVDQADLGPDDIPAIPAGTEYVLGAVRLYTGQTAINEARTDTDIVDLRFPMWHSHSDGLPVIDHDHSGDAGDGGTFPLVRLVAASDAPTLIKNRADYVCDGTADEQQVIDAVNDLPANGGRVELSEGTFNFAANYAADTAVGFSKSYVRFTGQGAATIIEVQADIAAFALLGGSGAGWYHPDAQSGVVFDHLKFTAATARTGAAIKNTGGINHLSVRDNYFVNLAKGIDFNGQAHGVSIVNNYSEGNRAFIRGAVAGAVLHDFMIFGNKESGMENAGYDATPVSFITQTAGEMFEWIIAHNSIEHLHDTGNASTAINLLSGKNADAIITGNSIEECDTGISYLGNFSSGGQDLSNLSVTNNSIRDVRTGIKASGSGTVLSEGNQYINFAANTTYRANLAHDYTGTFYCRDNLLTGYDTGKEYVESGTSSGVFDVWDVDSAVPSHTHTRDQITDLSIGQYAQYLYVVSGGDFTFIKDGDGNPVTGLFDLE